MNKHWLAGLPLLLASSALFAATELPSTFSQPEQQKLAQAEPEESNAVIIPDLQPEPTLVPSKPVELLGSVNADAAPITAPAPAQNTAMQQALKDALVYVYQNHPQLQAAREQLKATDESVALAVSDFRPSAIADYQKGRQRINNAGTSNWQYDDAQSRALTVTQPLFSGGEGIAGFKSAKQRVKAERANLIAVEQQVLFNVVNAFTDMVEKQSVLKLNQNNVDVLTQQRDATQTQFDVGELTRTDVAQAESRLATAVSNERTALGDVQIARAGFVRAVGYEPPKDIFMPDLPPGLPDSAQQAIEYARAANPVLEAAKHNEKAFASDVWGRAGAILPDVNLQGTMLRSSGQSLVPGDYDNDALTLNVTIPLYQSGAEWARLREARNLAQQAKFNTMDTSLAVSQDTMSAWENYKTAQAVITSSQSAVNANKIALDGVRQENEFGERSVLDVLNAEQEYLDAQVNLVRAVQNEKVQAYRLLASTGRLTAGQLGLDVKPYDPKEYYNSKKYQLLGW